MQSPTSVLVLVAAACLGGSVGCSSSRAPVTARLAVSGVPERVGELCAGVSVGDRERPFFFRTAGVEGMNAVKGEQANAKFAREELRGVEIAVRNTPGVTRHSVARVLRCHAAWRDALGFDLAAGAFEDPLTVGTPQVSFDETESGVVVRIEGRDQAEGEEILRRAEALLGTTSVAQKD